jgi:hypothetical protein
MLGCGPWMFSRFSLTTGEILAMGWFGQARYRLQGLRASHKVGSRVSAHLCALIFFFFFQQSHHSHNFLYGGLGVLVWGSICQPVLQKPTVVLLLFPIRHSVFLRAQTLSSAAAPCPPSENSVSLAKPRIRESIRTLRPVSRRLFALSSRSTSISTFGK